MQNRKLTGTRISENGSVRANADDLISSNGAVDDDNLSVASFNGGNKLVKGSDCYRRSTRASSGPAKESDDENVSS